MGVACSSNQLAAPGSTSPNKIPSFKIVLVGDVEVGKTSIFLRYYKNQFDYNYHPTNKVRIENVVKKLNIPEDTIASVTMWDLPGREDMDLRRTYYKDLDAVIVVVDTTDPTSIEMGATWKQDVLNNATQTRTKRETASDGTVTSLVEQIPIKPDSVPVLLLGNKYDKVEEQLVKEEIERSANSDNSESDSVTTQPSMANVTQLTVVSDGPLEREDANLTGSSQDGKAVSPTDDSGLPGGGSLVEEGGGPLVEEGGGPLVEEGDSFEKKAQEWEKERLLTQPPEGGKKVDDRRPECARLLERVAEEHGFISSVTVSAKDSDGSVHAAVQSFIRHLMERQRAHEIKAREATKAGSLRLFKTKKHYKKPKPKAGQFQPLADVGLKEFDELFARCSGPLKKSDDYSAYYEIALKKFKKACIDAHVMTSVTESKVNLEDCITNLKRAIGTGEHLQTEDSDGFIILLIEDEDSLKLSKPLKNAVHSFNTEFAAICRVVLSECPAMEAYLGRIDDKVATLSEQAWDIMMEAGKNQQDLRQIVTNIETNRARLVRARNQLTNTTSQAENAKKKVIASLAW